MSADIFISYASQDAKVARTICTALENRGFTCWISTRNIQAGENFQSSIVRAIRGAKVLLLVFTSNSNRSEEMTKELALASQQKLMVVPLRVENVDPSDAFAYEFATRQWIDLFSDWEQAMNNLCARLNAALSDDRSHVDTIVLGKPSLRAPGTKAVPRNRNAIAIGVVAALLIATIVGVSVIGSKPSAQAAAKPAAAPAATATPASVATPAAIAAPAATQSPALITAPALVPTVDAKPADTAVTPGIAAAVEPAAVPKPAPAPKPKKNLPY